MSSQSPDHALIEEYKLFAD
jgi:hypothetical protein